MSIKIGILGYGNLGRGVECAVKQNDDMELVAVFTRRNPEDVKILTETATVCNVADVEDWKDKIDVMIICGGSATDLPKQTPVYAKMFNVIDSFDTHARIPEHFANVSLIYIDKKNGYYKGINLSGTTSKNKFDVKLYLTYNTEDKQIERYIILHGNAT